MQNLKQNTTLQGGRYKIIETLGQGGFGITYLAMQTGLDRKVAIKEFFMKETCERDESTSHVTVSSNGLRQTVGRFREKFLKEARTIAKFNHPNIVRVIDVFEENGTAYYVMEYAENGSLADKVKKEGYLSEPVATRYILQLAEALDYIHQQKMNHLDVKPANVMLNVKDESVLIDFGLSKQYDATTGNQTSTTPVGISEGYAPLEQYKQGGVSEFSPATDIYALGATFFYLLTGVKPKSATEVYEDGIDIKLLESKGMSPRAISVISKAMESRKKYRMDNARYFIDGIKDGISSGPKPQSPSSKPAGEDDDTIVKQQGKASESVSSKPSKESPKREKNSVQYKVSDSVKPEPKSENDNTVFNSQGKVGEEKESKISDKHDKPKSSSRKWFVIGGVVVAIIAAIVIFTGMLPGKDEGKEVPGKVEIDVAQINTLVGDMIKVEGGTFQMGATSEQGSDAYDNEKPVHSVTFSNYYIGKTEVTQELWQAVMGSNPSEFKGNKKPVENVSWDDCQAFIEKLNTLTGKKFRLPTEAEWEFACRGGNKSEGYKYSGSNDIGSVAWYDGNSGNATHEVGTKQPNELGIYDMSGNVWEWCSDWYGNYSSNAQTNPTGPSSGSYRVFRGGSWSNGARICRSSFRVSNGPDYRVGNLGLRLACSE